MKFFFLPKTDLDDSISNCECDSLIKITKISKRTNIKINFKHVKYVMQLFQNIIY